MEKHLLYQEDMCIQPHMLMTTGGGGWKRRTHIIHTVVHTSSEIASSAVPIEAVEGSGKPQDM